MRYKSNCLKHLNPSLRKIDMALFITNTLFAKHLSGDDPVKTDNWKVEELMKKSKPELKDLYSMAERVRRGTANSEMLA